jgi:cytochrome c oxidase subunit 2
VGLHLPGKTGRSAARRLALPALLGAGALLLGGCSGAEIERGFMPEPGSTQSMHVLHLWQGAWIAALITGVIVWGLIFYAVIVFRRRSVADIPVQTRYNLPLEIFYTIAPVLMVIVFFAKTVNAQDAILDPTQATQNVIEVTGQQWSWTFNYGTDSSGNVVAPNNAADDNLDDQTFAYSTYSIDAGTASHVPTLVLPVGVNTRFNLHSPDVIHDFGVANFLMKMDVVPGRVNHYWVDPTKVTATFDPSQPDLISGSTYRGACYELCGLYHSRMLFRVAVVSQDDYAKYVHQLHVNGATDNHPYIGGSNAYTQAGLENQGEAQ